MSIPAFIFKKILPEGRNNVKLTGIELLININGGERKGSGDYGKY